MVGCLGLGGLVSNCALGWEEYLDDIVGGFYLHCGVGD